MKKMNYKTNLLVHGEIGKEQDPKVIIESNEFPFFRMYHSDTYIMYHDRRQVVSLKDKGATSLYYLQNNIGKELVCYRIDEGLIHGCECNKCDFAIYTEDDSLILVELKGVDYNKAIEQLSSTIIYLLKKHNISVSKLFTRAVLSRARVPDILLTKEKKFEKLIREVYHGNHKKCTKKCCEALSDICKI